MLADVRPELGPQPITVRREIRKNLVVDSAVMMHGYAALLRDFNDDLARLGASKAQSEWSKKLKRLSADRHYNVRRWSGDLFAKRNPLWRLLGIVKPGKDPQKLTVLNTGAARSECGRVLRQLLALSQESRDLHFLTKR
jgi:hypothetical protein